MQIARRVALIIGAVLVAFYAFARAAGEQGRRQDVAAFMQSLQRPDQTLWSATRIQAFDASRVTLDEKPLALLRIPSLSFAAPLYATPSEVHLNRGVALIQDMARPDEGGNVGIAGHRDGFFRVLKDITTGAFIEVQTVQRVHRYRVVSVDVVDATDNRLLADTAEPTVTLVTCYPFYYIGPAPQRFVVRGAYAWPSRLDSSHTP